MNKILKLIAFVMLLKMTDCSSEINFPQNSVEQGAFLANGRVYVYDFHKKDTIYLQLPNDSILGFSISPTKRYIAYSKFLKYADSPGIYDDSITPQEPLNSIVVYDFKNNKQIREILPSDYEFLSIDKWVSEDELLYVSADGIAVNGWLTYKINDSIKNLGYDKQQEELRSIVFSNDFKVKLFVDSLNELHMINLDSYHDQKVHQTEGNTYDIEITNDKKRLTWFEIKNVFDNKTNGTKTIDIVHLLTVQDNAVSEIYNEKAQGKGGKKCMKFSFNDSILSIELERKTQLINLFTKDRTSINGFDAYWINAKTLIYSNDNNLYLYDSDAEKSTLFRKNATNFEPKKYAR